MLMSSSAVENFDCNVRTTWTTSWRKCTAVIGMQVESKSWLQDACGKKLKVQ